MASKPKYMNYSLETLKSFIKNNSSFEEILSIMEYSHPNDKRCIAGLQKYLDANNIDYSHLSILQENKKIICKECGIEKEVSEYYSSNGKTRKVCKKCVRKAQNEKYHCHQKWLNDFKQTHPCVKCGCDKFYLIDFHHINPKEKDYSISDNPNASIETILKELEKCVSLCANCHREFHYLEREQNISLQKYLNGGVAELAECGRLLIC